MSATFTNMVEILKDGQVGAATLKAVTVCDHEAAMASLKGHLTAGGSFMTLHVGGVLMMSDTYYERRTNIGLILEARGDVLIGGLGLGMVLIPLLAKPEVTSVTVLEKYQDVIDLVLPQLAGVPGIEKLQVIQADCLTWQPPKGVTWDVIYWDIWPDICTDNLKEIAILKRRYAKRLRPGGRQSAWVEKELRSRKVQEERQRSRFSWR